MKRKAGSRSIVRGRALTVSLSLGNSFILASSIPPHRTTEEELLEHWLLAARSHADE